MNRWDMASVTQQKTHEPGLGDKVHKATLHTIGSRSLLVPQYPHWEDLRTRAREARLRALDRHAELLDQFCVQLRHRGISVTVVDNGTQAAELIQRLVLEVGTHVTKSKSMTSEEVVLNPLLESKGVQVTETDLGELIVQLAHQPPSHVTAPAIHLSIEDIAKIFRDKLQMRVPSWVDDPKPSVDESTRRSLAKELSLQARGVLRQRFLQAEVGITGANFLVSSSGTIVLVENEGNIQLTACLPKRHIVLAGIDKLIENEADLAVMLQLLPVSATAQRQTCYVSLFADRHKDMHVVLLDNGRRALMKDPEMRDVLTCIRCGACMNTCPVYRNVGGHAYGGVYPGPIGALLLPLLFGEERYADLPFSSSLCGACSEICPVRIPLHDRLLRLRARLTEKHLSRGLGVALPLAAEVLKDSSTLLAAASLYPFGRKLAPLTPLGKAWTQSRELPEPSQETFHAWWAHRKPNGSSPSSHEPHAPVPEAPSAAPAPALQVPQVPPEPVDLVSRFTQRIKDLGPLGETLLERYATRAEALAFLRSQLAHHAEDQVLIEGQPSEKRGYAIGVSQAALLIADSGGIVLDVGPRERDRISTLVETHVVLAHPSQLVPSIAEAIAERTSRRAHYQWSDYQVIVSGPSRTADVEKVLVIPAHGPRRLMVVLCDEPLSPADLL